MNTINKRYDPAVPIDQIKLHPRNVREGDLGAIIESIEANDFFGACIVQESTGLILVGNHRHQAAAHQGAETIPVIYVDVDDAHALRILLADNRTNDLATYNKSALAQLLREIIDQQGSLTGTGYDGDALDEILTDLGETLSGAGEQGGAGAGDESADAVDHSEELRIKWDTKVGQLWLLGTHRLRCGDSRSLEDVKILMGDRTAVTMWTDPPYGVNYVGKTKAAMTIQNDGAEDLGSLLKAAFTAADAVMRDGAAFYVAHPHGPLSVEFGLAVIAAGWKWHQTLVWVKDSLVLGHSDYHYRHEPILYGWKGSRNDRPWYGERDKTTVLEFPKPSRSQLHPTTKPTALIKHCLANSTAPGDLVYEPFSGSGSTMLACQETGRVCCANEIDPRFVAVCLERMSLLGVQPALAG